MKIVHIEDYFHPDAGYQINILPKYLSKFGHSQTIITSEMKKIPEELTSFFGKTNIDERDRVYEKENGVKIIRLPLITFLSGRAVFGLGLEYKLKKLKPDVIYVHGNDTLTGIRVILLRQLFSCRIVTDSHMLEMASKNKFNELFRNWYKLFITPIIKKNNIPVIRTQDDMYVEKCLGIPIKRAPWISYGSDVLLFHKDEKKKNNFRKKYNIENEALVIVYAGKLDESKGGLLLADAFKHRFEEREVVLIVVGNTIGEYGDKVEETFEQSENRIIRFPTQKYIDLAKFYQVADICVFAKQCSLSFYDAQACGLPVIAEDNNINKDRCSHDNGWVFKQGDKNDLRKTIITVSKMDSAVFSTYVHNAERFIRDNYNYETKAREYEQLLVGEK